MKVDFSVSKPLLRNLQVVIAAMAGGAIVFQLIALFVPVREQNTSPLLSYLAAGFAPIAIVMSILLPKSAIASMRQRLASMQPSPVAQAQLHQGFATATMLSGAALEGAALFATVAYMIERNWPLLVVFTILMAILLSRFPTEQAAERWMSEERKRVQDARGRA